MNFGPGDFPRTIPCLLTASRKRKGAKDKEKKKEIPEWWRAQKHKEKEQRILLPDQSNTSRLLSEPTSNRAEK